jgi:hypothetical protein
VGKSTQDCITFEFSKDKCVIKNNGHSHTMTCFNGGTFFSIETSTSTKSLFVLTNQEDNTLLWHQRLGHLNLRIIRAMQSKALVIGLIGNLKANIPLCQSCLACKQHQQPLPTSGSKRTQRSQKHYFTLVLHVLFPQFKKKIE